MRNRKPYRGLNLNSAVEVNGHRFVECTAGDASLPHLFGAIPAGVAGTFKRHKRRVDFYLGGVHVASMTQSGVFAKASRLPDGRTWYSYGDPDGIGEVSMRAADELRVALNGRCDAIRRGEPVYSFAA